MLAEITPVIGTPEIRAAAEILKQYRQGKANLEKRIIENDQWFKMRHWQQFRKNAREGDPEPEIWFHDIFRADYSPYDPAEIDFIRHVTGVE